jgi:hypothetical protein
MGWMSISKESAKRRPAGGIREKVLKLDDGLRGIWSKQKRFLPTKIIANSVKRNVTRGS